MKQTLVLLAIATILAFTATAQDQVSVKFQNADVYDVLTLFERLTDCKIVTDNQVVGQITLSPAQPVSKSEAIELIEQALFANGFSIIQTNSKTLRITGMGKNPRNEGIPIFSKPEDIPNGERLISFVIKLQFRQPDEILPLLQMYTAPSPTLGVVLLSDPTSGSIIVTERSSIVRNVLKLMKEIDVPKGK